MSIIATAVRHLMAAGVTGDALCNAIAELEAEIGNLRFLLRYVGEWIANLWRDLNDSRLPLPLWQRPFNFLNRCSRLTKRAKQAYLNISFEVDARAYAQANWQDYLPIVRALIAEANKG
jgi:hypothetical protein